jgi:BirA family biotin operon repressor/biotin-[acetyl-CoA-carboxylase] ligase
MNIQTIHLKTIDSTQTYAKAHAAQFSPNDLTCIVADCQTDGYGQFQRPWVSPKGNNLYVTFYFQIPNPFPHLTHLTSQMIQSVQTVLQQEGITTTIKHPNDLMLHGKKIAGALCETEFHEKHIECFLGLGLNLSLEIEDVAKINQPATSLEKETGKSWDKKTLLVKIQRQFLDDLRYL